MAEQLIEKPTDSRQKNTRLWGGLLILLGVIFGIAQTFYSADDLIPLVMLVGIGVTFYFVYHYRQERLWPLIVAFLCWGIAGGVLLDRILYSGPLGFLRAVGDMIVALYIAGVITLPFAAIYRRKRKIWLLVVPAFAWVVAGGVTLDEMLHQGFLGFLHHYQDAIIGTYVMSVLSAPLLYAYSRKQKWAWLIFPVLALFAMGMFWLDAMLYGGVLNFMRRQGEMIMGAYTTTFAALPFLFVYLTDRSRWWALIVGGALLSVSAAMIISGFIMIIPLIMIGGGGYLLYLHYRPQPAEPEAPLTDPISQPRTGPEADK